MTDEILSPLIPSIREYQTCVPGSAVYISNASFAKTIIVFDGDRQLPPVLSGQKGMWIQIPWEFASAESQGFQRLLIRSQNNPFESVRNILITPFSPVTMMWFDSSTGTVFAQATHQDSLILVTPSSPARPGEMVHIYLIGLGPLDQPVPTGAPGPSSPLAHPLATFRCRIGLFDSTTFLLSNVFYAVDRVGFYQADLIMPDVLPQGTASLYCETSSVGGEGSTGLIQLATTSVR